MEPTLRIKITLVDGTIIALEKALCEVQAFVVQIAAVHQSPATFACTVPDFAGGAT